MNNIFVIITFLMFSLSSMGKKSKDEMEMELLDFSNIKNVLKSDGLANKAKKKEVRALSLKKKRLELKKSRFNIPASDTFWSFISEYWIVKNAAIMKWDFRKPDYGLDLAFREFLENIGIYEKTFKILLVDTPNISHFALPSNKNELIFILSVPFIKTLDLSKLEISVLLFEDYLRNKRGYFKSKLMTKELGSFIGSNYQGRKLNNNIIAKVMTKMDEIIYVKGFNFQEQFEVTKEMNLILKSDLKIWNIYLGMIRKIDDLIKSNVLYKKYGTLYPSPELQINWLTPKKTKL